MVVKHCAHGHCTNDSRYPTKPPVMFFRFPSNIKQPKKCLRWVKACRRKNFSLSNVTNYTYICSWHFKDPSGPTEEFPDPISEVRIPARRRLTCQSLQVAQSQSNLPVTKECEKDVQTTVKTYGKANIPGSEPSKVHESDEDTLVETVLPDEKTDFIHELFITPQKTTTCTEHSDSGTTSTQLKPLFNPPVEECSLPISIENIGDAMHMGYHVGQRADLTAITFSVIEGACVKKTVTVDLVTGLYTVHIIEKRIDTDLLPNFPAYLTSGENIIAMLNLLLQIKVCPGPNIKGQPRSTKCSHFFLSTAATRCVSCANARRYYRQKLARRRKGKTKLPTMSRRKLMSCVRAQKYKLLLTKRKLERANNKFRKLLEFGK